MLFKTYRLFIFISFIFLLVNEIFSQEAPIYELKWTDPIEFGLEGEEKSKLLHFESAQYDFTKSELPYFFAEINQADYGKVNNGELKNQRYETVSAEEALLLKAVEIPMQIEVKFFNSTISKKNHSYLSVLPFRKSATGQIEKLVSFELDYEIGSSASQSGLKTLTFASESKLKEGDWYKIGVTKNAIYKLDYNFLSNLGIDLANIDPRTIQLYGYGSGMLPESNSISRPDDMVENAIVVNGEQDGSFDPGDYITFYGEEQVEWRYDPTYQRFRHTVNLYSDTTFYFIRTGIAAGKRIIKETRPTASPQYTTTEFDDRIYYEKESTNLLKSGSLWVGEIFDNNLSFNLILNVPNVNTAVDGKIELSVLARAGVKSLFTLSTNGQNFTTEVGSSNLNRYEFQFAQPSRSFFDFTPNSGVINMILTYNKPQVVAKGWLNSITVNLRRNLIFQGEQLFFRDANAQANSFAEYIIQSQRNLRIWDLTDKYNIKEKSIAINGNNHSIISENNNIKEFVAFNKYDTLNVFAKGSIANQNLHGMQQAELVIIAHPLFLAQAIRLADFHRDEGLTVNVVSPQQIYNEYSSGSQDLIAIRSYLKMLYDRSTSEKDLIKYVVMFGDASYDFKNRISGNTNFVPAFQSKNALDPINSYVSDDYFSLLDDNEGEWPTDGSQIENLDVAIGRLPVQNIQEAEAVVDKIIRYAAPSTLGDWRNKIVFVGDDEDGFVHMSQSNDLSKIVEERGKDFNNEKIFLDAYQQQATASGARYPGVTADINQSVQDGSLIVNYTGHGGETGWTAERVLSVSDITSWENLNNMPAFVTATCEFSRYDDPLRTSAGELVLLNPNGGGIGLMTTTRLVFSSPNYLLNRTFYEKIFERKADGSTKRLGDVFQEVKNVNAYSNNSRNFSLLGDPAVKLAIPQLDVITTEINGNPVAQIDTLKALSTVTIKGFVADHNGNKLSNFNGLVYPTIFDKVENKKTLNNDGAGVFSYQERESRIFKGKASVSNGDFSFSFVVPKDISYSFGNGKISYYTENGIIDGNGYNEDFIIGGSNLNAISDNSGPDMTVYLNDESFVYGGITDNNPILMVELSDELGINTVGSGIGHDLIAVLDNNTENAIVLNDYYEAEVDDYSKGKINFQLKDLSEGKHTLKVKAWDVANNSSEKSIEFNVVESKEIEIDNLVNYPNPFTTNTEFIFQHNQAGTPLDVKLEVFTVSGKLVKSINQVIVNEGFISRDIHWNGRDDYGDKIGKGVYVYKIKVRSRNGTSTEKIEKLVIL